MLEFRSVSFSYGSRVIYRDFSLSLDNCGVTALLGPSGCGKTTLIHLSGGLDVPSSGSVSSDLGGEERAAYVFQEPRLLPWRTILQNVELPLRHGLGRRAARERALRFLALVGLTDRAESSPSALSGGQRQRVSLARAFAFPAPLVLMDEPFQSLDPPLRVQAMGLVEKLLAEEPRTLLFVTHDPAEALRLADRIVVLGGSPACVVLDEKVPFSAQIGTLIHAALEGASRTS